MYTVIRTYHIIPGTVEELLRQVQHSLLPLLSRVPGFHAYYVMQVADSQVAAISLFERLADAKAAVAQVAAWMREYSPLFCRGSSEVLAGPVAASIEPACLSPPSQQEPLQAASQPEQWFHPE